MHRVGGLILVGGCLALSGCYSMPFDPPPPADYREVDPAQVVDEFDAHVAKKFEVLQSVVFEFFGKSLTGLGYLSVEGDAERYMLTCMTPAGIKLFEFRGEGDHVEALFVPPPLEDVQEHFIDSVAQDIRRIYLDWTPGEDATVKQKKDRLLFREGPREYVFAGPEHTLAEKHERGWWRKKSSVYYFNYNEQNGKIWPTAIVLQNRTFHYRLILRVKSVQCL